MSGGGLALDATELRLGLPGDGDAAKSGGKRAFEDAIDLKLKLPVGDTAVDAGVAEIADEASDAPPENPPAPKAQIVGWPPVRSYRKSTMAVRSSRKDEQDAGGSAMVKVSLDGAPYLRKIDLKSCNSYSDLSSALEKLFTMSSFAPAVKGGSPENGKEFLPTYEDKDGDWMLVGDVPWEMFVESCKRLRIMKRSNAGGL